MVSGALDARSLVFVDEMGTNTSLSPLYGWSKKGQRAYGSVSFREMKDGGGYRWRLSSAGGETLERSEGGPFYKGECEREVSRLKQARDPDARVLDATGG